MNEKINGYSSEEILTQILANQRIILLTLTKFVTPHCADMNNESWLKINNALVSEYHRTKEIIGEEEKGKYPKNNWLNKKVRR